MDKRPSFKIKYKIILLMTLSLVAAIAFYTYYATDLFKEDKKAYIFENILNTSSLLNNDIKNNLLVISRDFEILEKLLQYKKTLSVEEFLNKSNFIDGLFLNSAQNKYFYTKNQFLKQVDIENILKDDKSSILSFRDYFIIQENSLVGSTYFIVKKELFTLTLDQNRAYHSVLLNQNNSPLFSNLLQRGFGEDIVQELISVEKPTNVSSQILNFKNKKYLFTITEIKSHNLKLINIIDYDQAFSVTNFLVKKSILFGLFILLLISGLAILFSSTITNSIEKLYTASRKIAAGDFNTNIEKLSNDEIGSLGQAFNFMIAEIRRYMEEMKEKLRLENEIKVAKIVQENFFPAQDTSDKNFDIMAFNTPSTECGGDWWGFHQINNKLIIIIADATGHGVPAALLTSSINTAFNSAKYLIEKNKLECKSDALVEYLNRCLSQTKTNVMLTAFAAVIDLESKILEYTNASHLDALLIPHKNVALEKSDILPLIEAKGARLGQDYNFIYSSSSTNLNSGDIILMQTDGIIESQNGEGQAFGIRRLIKTIIDSKTDAFEIRENIIKNFKDFCAKDVYEDDITLVCVKIK